MTGHTTTQIVLDHYFQPGREEFRTALMGAMPAVLTGEAAKPPVSSGQLAVGSGEKPVGSGETNHGRHRTHGTGDDTCESEVAALAGKVAAGSASEAEKARLGELLRA